MKRALVIFNPVSGMKLWYNVRMVIFETLSNHGFQMEWFETQKVKKQPLERFKEQKFDRIIAAGGDGTVAQAVSFLVENQIKTPLIIIPQGSANLAATALGLPLWNLKKGLAAGLTAEGKPLDVMQINNKIYGLLAVGTGYDTLLMRKTPRKLKRTWGALAYLWTFLKTIFWYRASLYKLTIDGKRYQLMAKAISVFNLLPFSELKVSKKILRTEILPQDGKVNVFVLNPKSIWDFFRFRPKIQTFSGKTVIIKQKQERRFQIDGDIFKSRVVKIETKPQAIKVVHDKEWE